MAVVDAQPPPATHAAKPMPGRAHVVVRGTDDARVLVDGRVVASGVREARFWTSRRARRTPCASRRWIARPTSASFTVAAGTEAELEVSLAPTMPPAVEPHPAAQHGKRHDVPAGEDGAAGLAHGAAARHVKTPTPRRPGRRRHLRRQVAGGPRDYSASRLALRAPRCFDRGMPRVRLTAGRWLALAVISGGLCVSPVLLSPVARRRLRRGPRPARATPRPNRPDRPRRMRGGATRSIRCNARMRRSPEETLQHRRRLADDAARPAGRHPRARRQGGRAAAAPGCQRRLAALQLDRARGAPAHADQLRAVPRPAGGARGAGPSPAVGGRRPGATSPPARPRRR